MDLTASLTFASSGPVPPPGSFASLAAAGVRLLTGPRSLLRAGLAWTLAHLPPPVPLVVVDGGRSFEVDLLVEVAGHLGESARDLVARVRVARAATAHQLVALVEAADHELERAGGRHALVLAPLDLLRVADPRQKAAGRLEERLVAGLEALGRPPRSAVVVCPDPPAWAGVRAGSLDRLTRLAAAHFRFDDDQPVS